MEHEKIEVCNQCSKHCPKENLKCGKGRRYFAEERNSLDLEHSGGRREGIEEKRDLSSLMMSCCHILNSKSGKMKGKGRILKILVEQPEMSQEELQDKLQMEAGSLREIVSKLEVKGFIRREKDETHKKRMKLFLTEKGTEELKKIDERSQEEHLFRAITQEERETLERILDKLVSAWETQHKERKECFGRGEGRGCGHGRKGRHGCGHGDQHD